MPLTSKVNGLALTLVVVVAAAPLAATYAEAGGRKKGNGMMRLGGPNQTSRPGNPMRLGGPVEGRSIDSGIYVIPGRFVSNRPDDVRQFFLRHDQQGSGN